MRRVEQTIFGDGKGNCFAACIASILDLSIEEVPNFVDLGPIKSWFLAVNDWLVETRRHFYLHLETKAAGNGIGWGYHVMNGMGPRGVMHSVVGFGDVGMVWDPHPSHAGLMGDPDSYGLIVSRWES